MFYLFKMLYSTPKEDLPFNQLRATGHNKAPSPSKLRNIIFYINYLEQLSMVDLERVELNWTFIILWIIRSVKVLILLAILPDIEVMWQCSEPCFLDNGICS
mmetsp:Transcript_16941/g.25133  ORF Transcript_16941/g.25133 Transcript_16941/m.25133 type:complete len:102 (+) Transcript_16941:1018-1323(+)